MFINIEMKYMRVADNLKRFHLKLSLCYPQLWT